MTFHGISLASHRSDYALKSQENPKNHFRGGLICAGLLKIQAEKQTIN